MSVEKTLAHRTFQNNSLLYPFTADIMRTVRTLATVIIVLSLLYVLDGAYIIWQAVKFKTTLAYYGVPDSMEFGTFTVAALSRVSIIAGSVFIICGLMGLISGISLFRLKEWARKIWLVIVLLLLLINIPLMAWYYLSSIYSDSLIIQALLEVLTFVLTIISWIALTQEQLKSIFRSDVVEIRSGDYNGSLVS